GERGRRHAGELLGRGRERGVRRWRRDDDEDGGLDHQHGGDDHEHGADRHDHHDEHDQHDGHDGHDDHDEHDQHDGHDGHDDHDEHDQHDGHDGHDDHDEHDQHDGHDGQDQHNDNEQHDGPDDDDRQDRHDGHDHHDEHDQHDGHDGHDDHDEHDQHDGHDGHDDHDEHDQHDGHDGHDNHHEHDQHDGHDGHDDHHEHHQHDGVLVQLRGWGTVESLVHDRGRLRHLWPSRLGHERELLVTELRRALLRRCGRGGAAALHRPRPGDVVQQGGVHRDGDHPEWHVADRGGRQPLLGRLESPQRLHDGRRLPGRHVQVPAVHERGLPVRPAAADPEPLPPGRGHQQLRHQLDHGQCRGDGRLLDRLDDGSERAAELRHLPGRRLDADAVLGWLDAGGGLHGQRRLRHRAGRLVPGRHLRQRHRSLPWPGCSRHGVLQRRGLPHVRHLRDRCLRGRGERQPGLHHERRLPERQ